MASTFLVVKNDAASTLAGAVNGSSDPVTFSVAAGQGALFPSTFPFHISIDSEILSCTARATDALTCTRAQQGTTIAAHASGADVELRVTAKSITDLNSAVNTLEGVPGSADASTTVKGVTKLATAPVSAANPIAVGDNDPRNTNARTPSAHTHPLADLTTDPLARANHTGTQVAATIADFDVAVDAREKGLRVAAHKTGLYFPPHNFTNSTAGALTQDRAYYVPFWVGVDWPIVEMGIWVTVGGAANSVYRFGIFDTAANGQPGTVLEDLGTVAVDTTAVPTAAWRSVVPSGGVRTLAPGQYWYVAVGQNSASPGTGITMATVQRCVLVGVGGAAGTTAAPNDSLGGVCYQQSSVTAAFATAVPATGATSGVPHVSLKTQ